MEEMRRRRGHGGRGQEDKDEEDEMTRMIIQDEDDERMGIKKNGKCRCFLLQHLSLRVFKKIL